MDIDLGGETFYKKELQKTNKMKFKFSIEKVIRKKATDITSNGRVIHAIAGLITQIYYKDELVFSWTV